uniref:Uncharacterized protein n=1 Tax=Globodera rostochiensis TaxID=31243 RepID=A0A914GTY5_GLORO
MSATNAKFLFLVISCLLSNAFAAEQSAETTTSAQTSAETPTTSASSAGGHGDEKGERQQSGAATTAAEPGPSDQKVSPLSAEKSKPEEGGSGGGKQEASKTASPSSGTGVSSGTAASSAEVSHSGSADQQQQPANGVPSLGPLSAVSLLSFAICAFLPIQKTGTCGSPAADYHRERPPDSFCRPVNGAPLSHQRKLVRTALPRKQPKQREIGHNHKPHKFNLTTNINQHNPSIHILLSEATLSLPRPSVSHFHFLFTDKTS